MTDPCDTARELLQHFDGLTSAQMDISKVLPICRSLIARTEALRYAASGLGLAYDAASKGLTDEALLHCGHHEAAIQRALSEDHASND